MLKQTLRDTDGFVSADKDSVLSACPLLPVCSRVVTVPDSSVSRDGKDCGCPVLAASDPGDPRQGTLHGLGQRAVLVSLLPSPGDGLTPEIWIWLLDLCLHQPFTFNMLLTVNRGQNISTGAGADWAMLQSPANGPIQS